MATNLDVARGLATANLAIEAKYEEIYGSGSPGMYKDYCEVIQNQGAASIELDWLANQPVMRKWLGAKQLKGLRHYSQTITYDKYEASLILERTTVAYDKIGAVGRAINNFMKGGETSVDKSIHDAFDVASGVGPTGFDGVVLFSASHPHGPTGATTQSNIGAGSNLSHSTLVTARQVGQLLLHENGFPASVSYTHMRVGPKLEVRAKELISADRVQTATAASVYDAGASAVAAATRSNVWHGEYTLMVDPLRTTFYWDMYDLSGPARPMVMFNLRNPEVVEQTDMSDPMRFSHDKFVWSLEGDWGIGAGHWHTAYRGTGTA